MRKPTVLFAACGAAMLVGAASPRATGDYTIREVLQRGWRQTFPGEQVSVPVHRSPPALQVPPLQQAWLAAPQAHLCVPGSQ